MSDLTWVEHVQTVDAIEKDVIRAMEANPGWRLLHVGTGSGGQTTLTYGWPWAEGRSDGQSETAPTDNAPSASTQTIGPDSPGY